VEEKRLEENRHLREKLNKLLKEARRNEQTQSSFDDFTFSVVAAQGPKELFHLILKTQKKFRIDKVRLCLIDRFHEVERLLTENYQHHYTGLSFIDTKTSKLLISDIPDCPILGTRIIRKHASAFSSETRYTTIKNNLFMEKPNESRRNKLF
jgi:hypothetical protein